MIALYYQSMIKQKQEIISSNKQKFSRGLTSGQNTNESKGLITKQFINKLRLEISQKIKPSKSILQALKHSNTINQNYKVHQQQLKANIQQLNMKVQELTQQNQKLKQRILELQEALAQSQKNNTILKTSSQQRQKHTDELNNISSHQVQQSHLLQIQILKQKVKHLQQYKTVKQVRFQEIIERQAQYVGEINILKYKNENLQSSIKSLQSSIYPKHQKMQQEDQQKLNRKKSEQSQKFKEYINHEDSKQDEISIEEIRVKYVNHLAIPTHNNILLQSYTNNIEIQEEFDLQKMTQGSKKMQNRSFMEIQGILAEDLSSEKTFSNQIPSQTQIGPNNLNNSIVVIHINQPSQNSNFNI